MMNNVNGRGTGNTYHFSFAKVIKFTMGKIYNGYMEFKSFIKRQNCTFGREVRFV